MRKIVATVALALAVVFTTQAQKEKRGDFEKLSVIQKANLKVKKMALKLDLTTKQQNQIKPLLVEQIEKRKTKHEEFKKMKESKKKLSADERYKMQSERLDDMIAFKANMKSILTPKQFEKFEKMSKHKAKKMKRKMKRAHRKREKNHEDDMDR